jgi:hypothetical protein
MKNIKSIIAASLASAMLLISPSCKKVSNFLDKAPGVNVDENALFSSKIQLDFFLATIYKNSIPTIYNYQNNTNSTTAFVGNAEVAHLTYSMCDEGKCSEQGFISSNKWNFGQVIPSEIVIDEDYKYYLRFIALREIALMLKRVDEVPDALPAYKSQVKAEVKTLRALLYLEMVKRYGGVPIITQVFDAGVNINDLVPRASVSDVFAFITKDCEEAIPDLPPIQLASLVGRVTKLAAYAVKAKALLYAASPLFNTATPYLDFGANNKLICYGNYDVNRWQLAADAAKAVLDNASDAGVSLIDVPANRNPPISIPAAGPGPAVPIVGNYSNAWEKPNNTELILAYQGSGFSNAFNPPLKFISPLFNGTGWSGVTVPLNFFGQYEKMDGTPQNWSAAGGNDLLGMYNQLDPRFKQTMAYTTGYWNPTFTVLPIYAGAGITYDNCFGGVWMHKLLPRNAGTGVTVDITFSLHEFYLDYAEAQNEAVGPGTETALSVPVNFATAQIPTINSPFDAINKIRLRSAMPPVSGLNQSQFRDRVRHERLIELAYEGHRFWDIRRWMIAENEGVMQGAMKGIRINKLSATAYSWLPYTFETRIWLRQEYLHPFPQTEVNKGGLIQNPGW